MHTFIDSSVVLDRLNMAIYLVTVSRDTSYNTVKSG
jgi:hypothetical protein